jgi:ribosomal protein S18 acetylase RimI-like enzyme
MVDGILIRPATTQDAAPISELVTALADEFIASEFSSEGAERLLNSLTVESIRKYMQAGYRYFVAACGDELVGVVATRGDSHLYHLFVAVPFQRRGLARQLWQVAQAACIASARTREFTVNSSCHAVAAYERLGFVRQAGPQDLGGVIAIPMKLTIE